MIMNEDYIKQTNSTQAGLLMTSLDSLREQNILCDFDVKVGDKSFCAHRCSQFSSQSVQQLTSTSTRADTETSLGNIPSSSRSSGNAEEPQMGAVGGYRDGASESQSSSQATLSGLRTINQQPPGGRMSVRRLREPLPGYRWGTLVITSFPAGSLNGVSYEAKKFTEYLPADFYIRNLLRKAFNTGLLFKIQIIGSSRGEIIWNDEFPHKTNKLGGPDNNGYPDRGH
ncbi:uncharacterized protein LOC120332021 [Styela clava]